ncbi:Na(+)-translocating NADH-quinone reductase subunit D (Na(+)-NQR subunit D) like [Quillaja saponaria]|uniref:Na(+)-translocating NADH-quinone reductase subunit D (Na(+)-NQR subunit D) like n=1 Tax=Quillaja saponaria TaxID=32244 RepID=A0AAD7KNT3_QUISA|nr:Na(+)-translocating NADH-quinone reductase subunit D (Na(+)-NQR subunit D) like [Quillaja saponaria]
MYGMPRKPTQEGQILWVSIATALALIQFPYQKINGNPVPTIIFNDKPTLFHAFILSLNFSFFGSFTTITLRDRHPRLARCCLLLAVVSMAIGAGIVLWLTVPMSFKLIARYFSELKPVNDN